MTVVITKSIYEASIHFSLATYLKLVHLTHNMNTVERGAIAAAEPNEESSHHDVEKNALDRAGAFAPQLLKILKLWLTSLQYPLNTSMPRRNTSPS